MPAGSDKSLYALISTLLGVKVGTEVDLISILEKGLPASTVRHLRARAPLSNAEVSQLIAPRRTLRRREASGQILTPREADKTIRIARVFARAQQVFAGKPDYAAEWLRETKSQLGDRKPLSALAAESGAFAVEEMLLGIEHGLFN